MSHNDDIAIIFLHVRASYVAIAVCSLGIECCYGNSSEICVLYGLPKKVLKSYGVQKEVVKHSSVATSLHDNM